LRQVPFIRKMEKELDDEIGKDPFFEAHIGPAGNFSRSGSCNSVFAGLIPEACMD
jgi:hypothetical protein